MTAFQPWLVKTLLSVKLVSTFMHSKWGWPTCESVHFLGLSMLIGAIGIFDLRLLGMAKRIPLAALHRVIPWGVAGYFTNMTTGAMFLVTEPDQYIYNPSFHFKLLFMALAGLNILVFYLLTFRKLLTLSPGEPTPWLGRIAGGVSLCAWIGVIVCGRLLTFYRPGWCGGLPTAWLYYCVPGSPK